MNIEKSTQLDKLVEQRRDSASWIPEGFLRLGDARLNGGFYECEHVVPWTKGACDYDAKLMLIGQDWAGSDLLERPLTDRLRKMNELGRDDHLPTNKAIHKLLSKLGLSFSQTYATDLCPFIKPSHMRSGIRLSILEECARQYALKQISIIKPRIVVCLGRSTTFPAIYRAATGQRRIALIADRPLGPFDYCGAEVYGVTHPGSNGNRRPGRIASEWAFLKDRLKALV